MNHIRRDVVAVGDLYAEDELVAVVVDMDVYVFRFALCVSLGRASIHERKYASVGRGGERYAVLRDARLFQQGPDGMVKGAIPERVGVGIFRRCEDAFLVIRLEFLQIAGGVKVGHFDGLLSGIPDNDG